MDLDELAERTDGYVGADIEAVCREAAQIAVREYVGATDTDVESIDLPMDHFERALETVEATDDEPAAAAMEGMTA